MAMIGSSDSMLDRTIGYTRLVRWDPAWTKILPDLAEERDGEQQRDASSSSSYVKRYKMV